MRSQPPISPRPTNQHTDVAGQHPKPGRLPASRPRPRPRPDGVGVAFLMITLAAVVLTGCGASGNSSPAADAPSKSSAAPSTPRSTPADGPRLEVSVIGDKVTPTGKEMKLGVGKTLTITVTSDRAGELHVHSSPEQELEYGKGKTTLTVTIDKPGVVDVEDHIADALVAQLQVS